MVGFVDAPGVSAGCAARGGAVGVAGGSADAGRGARTSGAVGGLAWTGGSTGGIATGATAALDEKGVVLATALGGLAWVLAAVTSTPVKSAMTRQSGGEEKSRGETFRGSESSAGAVTGGRA